MKRISKNEFLMGATFLVAKRSTCAMIQVGAVIAIDGHIISTGYNGSAPKQEHCYDYFGSRIALHQCGASPENVKMFQREHHTWELKNELHAEVNAILFAARKGIKVEGADLFCTHFPCTLCVKMIVNSGIKRVFYCQTYRPKDSEESLKILKNNNVFITRAEI